MRFPISLQLLHCVVYCVVIAGRASADDLDRIMSDWSKRSDQIHCLKIVAEGETTDAKGFYSRTIAAAQEPELSAKAPEGDVPPEDYTYAERATFVLDFDHNLARKEKSWQEFSFVSFAHVPKFRVWLFDGKDMQLYEPRDAQIAAGHVPQESDAELTFAHKVLAGAFFETCDLAPFIGSAVFPTPQLTVTPQRMRLPLDRNTFQINGTALLDGRIQHVLKTPSHGNNPGRYVEMWVDLARDSIVTRWIHHGIQRIQFDICYVHSANGWMPETWKYQWWKNDRLARWSQMRVVETAINPNVGAISFRIEPTPGMIVQDDRGESRRVVVKGAPGEADREIGGLEDLQGEKGRTKAWRLTMAVVGGSLIVLAVLTILGRRWRKRGERSASPP
jgi:hypothetical protein